MHHHPLNMTAPHTGMHNCSCSSNHFNSTLHLAAVASPQASVVTVQNVAGDTSSDQPISTGAIVGVLAALLVLFIGLGACAWQFGEAATR
jgi:uncharacterized protein HemX